MYRLQKQTKQKQSKQQQKNDWDRKSRYKTHMQSGLRAKQSTLHTWAETPALTHQQERTLHGPFRFLWQHASWDPIPGKPNIHCNNWRQFRSRCTSRSYQKLSQVNLICKPETLLWIHQREPLIQREFSMEYASSLPSFLRPLCTTWCTCIRPHNVPPTFPVIGVIYSLTHQ